MVLTKLSFISIVAYSSWNVWVLTTRSNFSVSKLNIALSGMYIFFMTSMLAFNIKTFLLVSMLAFLANCSLGVFTEVFHPEKNGPSLAGSKLIHRYWGFIITDGAITLTSFACMLCAGV